MAQEAVGGQEALEVFSAWQPHLVWMDMRMPDVDVSWPSILVRSTKVTHTVILWQNHCLRLHEKGRP